MTWGARITEGDGRITPSLTYGHTFEGTRENNSAARRIPRQRDRAADRAAADRARLRELAGRGALGSLTDAERRQLVPAALEIAGPIVYDVVTRRVARGRGHGSCGHGLERMEESCLDGFHCDLEAVVDHLLASRTPIADLEGWLAGRAPHAVIDGHRRRRGEQGALQRPRMTKALEAALDDEWLRELALKILGWVGLPAGVGATLWPVDSWARDRADRTGDHAGSTTAQVLADVDRVLEVMRRRPDWYAQYVERPLGRKTAPVGGVPGERAGEPRPLVADEAEADEARIVDLATVAVEAIRAGLRGGRDATATVVEVLSTLFLAGTGSDEMNRVPGGGSGGDQRLSVQLGDPAALSVLVQRVLDIVRAGVE